jgi:hypothetical protein
MAQKRNEDSDKLRFIFRYSSPVMNKGGKRPLARTSIIHYEEHEHDEDHTHPKLVLDTKVDAGHANLDQEKEHCASAAL